MWSIEKDTGTKRDRGTEKERGIREAEGGRKRMRRRQKGTVGIREAEPLLFLPRPYYSSHFMFQGPSVSTTYNPSGSNEDINN